MTDGKWCRKTNCRKGVEERKTNGGKRIRIKREKNSRGGERQNEEEKI